MSTAGESHRLFRIALLGLNSAQISVVKSLCKLSQHRSCRYLPVPTARYADANIVIFDGDNPKALSVWRSLKGRFPEKPSISVRESDDADPAGGTYKLCRARFGGHLLKLLDRIATKDLQFRPSILVSDENRYAKGDPVLKVEPATDARPAAGRALVVDDSGPVRAQMRILLKAMNLSVDLAESAESGLSYARSKKYDIIFMDVMLPEMDGYQACKLLKAEDRSKETPVVMLTGKTSPFNKVRGVMAGCDQYLTKPADESQLKQVVSKFVAVHA